MRCENFNWGVDGNKWGVPIENWSFINEEFRIESDKLGGESVEEDVKVVS